MYLHLRASRVARSLCFLVFFIISINCTGIAASTRGKVLQIDPSGIEYLSNSFDQLLVFFLEERNDEYEQIFQEFVLLINATYPDDHTLYAVTYFNKDPQGKLAKFNNNSDGFRIITKRNHYQMDFTHDIKQFDMVRKFYAHHVHPVLPLVQPGQFSSVETEYFLVMEHNSRQVLQNYIKEYQKLYDFLKLFNVRAVGVESQSNQSKLHIYKKSNPSKPVATFANQLNNIEELIDFINVQTLPLVVKLDDQNYVRVFGSFLDTQLLLIYDQKAEKLKEVQQIRQQMHKVSQYNRQQELKYHRILVAESSTQFLSKYFDDSVTDMKNQKDETMNWKILLTKTDYSKFQLRRFNFNQSEYGKPTKKSLLKFIEDVRMKKIDAEYKSEKIPTQDEQKQNVLRKIVGKSFISEIYERPDESVAVLFIDSKDQSSYRDIKKAFEDFTLKYKDILAGKLVSAIFDLAKNENKFLSIRSAPVLSLFQRTNKKSPKNFKGYPKVQNMKNWINYEIKDFTIPENHGEEILPLGAPAAPKQAQKGSQPGKTSSITGKTSQQL